MPPRAHESIRPVTLPACLFLTVVWQLACGTASVDPSRETAAAEAPPTSSGATEDPTPLPEALFVADHEAVGVEVDLLDVSRTGDALTVRWRYRTTLAEGVRLADGDDPYVLTRDAFLYDVHQKKYLVVEDGAGRPVAAEHAHDAGVVVKASAPLVAWAKFPAPPEDVERIAVHIPGVEVFERVGIGR